MAVAAAFCIVAFASVDLGNASDAASGTYEVYVEVIDAKGTVTDTTFVYFESDADNAKFAEAANKAFAAAGLIKLKFEVDEKYGLKVAYDGSGINATYYSDGKAWVAVADGNKDYIEHAKIGLAVGYGYISEEVYAELTVDQQAYWEPTIWGAGTQYAYMKELEVAGTYGKIVEFKVNLTMIDDDLIKTSSEVIKFTCENEAAAWCYAFNKAVKGNSIFSKTSAEYSIAGSISIWFGDSFTNATYEKVSGKWVAVEDTAKSYTSGNELDFELKNGYISAAQYGKLSASEQKNWQDSGMTGDYAYMRVPSASSSSSGDFPVVYVVVAIVAIVIIACAAYYLMKNKKTA